MVFLERPLNFHGFWTPRVYIYMSFLVMWLIGKVKKGLFQHLSLSTFHNWWLMISEGFVRRLSQLCWETETFRGFFFGFGIELRKKRTLLFFCISGMQRSKGGNSWKPVARCGIPAGASSLDSWIYCRDAAVPLRFKRCSPKRLHRNRSRRFRRKLETKTMKCKNSAFRVGCVL